MNEMTTRPDPDGSFGLSLSYAPDTYDGIDLASQGTYSVLEMPKGNPVGVLWTDERGGTGFYPADAARCPQSPDAAEMMFNALKTLKAQGASAETAFNVICKLHGVFSEGPEQGLLSKVIPLAASLTSHAPMTAAGNAPKIDAQELIAIVDDDTGVVKELVLAQADGMYIRTNGTWQKLPDDDDSLDGPEWIPVSPNFAPVWDKSEQSRHQLTRKDAKQYEVPI